MKRLFLVCCMFLVFGLAVTPANALLVGGPDIIEAPDFVFDDYPGATNYGQQAFDEKQDVYLEDDLVVDGGSIFSGLYVDSHMIFFNTPNTRWAQDIATWTFDSLIIGVMSDSGGILEANSNDLLGAEGTVYPGGFSARGMESGGSDWYEMIDDYTLQVQMTVTEPGDWIRVVTEASPVPEPSTLLLFGIGLLSLVGLHRHRKFKKN